MQLREFRVYCRDTSEPSFSPKDGGGRGADCHYGVLLVGSRVVLTAMAGTELGKDRNPISRSTLGTPVGRQEPSPPLFIILTLRGQAAS